jgi:hypothetical protein
MDAIVHSVALRMNIWSLYAKIPFFLSFIKKGNDSTSGIAIIFRLVNFSFSKSNSDLGKIMTRLNH